MKCECEKCRLYDLYRWAVISECGCACHNSDIIIGHNSLCCEFPNGKRKDNPYTGLKSAEYYKKKLEEI